MGVVEGRIWKVRVRRKGVEEKGEEKEGKQMKLFSAIYLFSLEFAIIFITFSLNYICFHITQAVLSRLVKPSHLLYTEFFVNEKLPYPFFPHSIKTALLLILMFMTL